MIIFIIREDYRARQLFINQNSKYSKNSFLQRTSVYFLFFSCYTLFNNIAFKKLGSYTMNRLKDREQKILAFMRSEIKTKGYPPTVREICTALGIKSTSTVHKDIASLVDQGFLKKDPSKPRAYMIVEQEEPAVAAADAQVDVEEREDVVEVPIVGNVAAGTPILAEQNIEDTFPVPARYAGGSNFMLRVRGESMINVGIMDGDLILVEQQKTARNGEIVVAMIDGFESEATVKTFYHEGDHIRLQPENDTMSPIIVRDVSILGKVKGVFRYFS